MAHHPHDHNTGTPHLTTPQQHHGMPLRARLFITGIIVADLFALVYFGGTLILTGNLITHPAPAKIIVAGADAPATGTTEAAAAAPAFDLASYVADPVKGAQVAAKCKACHNFDNGGPNRTGPNLWGIVDAPVEHKADFAYSDAMTAHKAKAPTWTEANLHEFIENPKADVPGTKMTFNGVRDPRERADLIAWLKTLK